MCGVKLQDRFTGKELRERLEFELDGINSGSWFRCLPIRIYHYNEREIVQQLCAKQYVAR